MRVPTARPLEGRAAIVTGASKGIGAALAVGLAHAGADVVVNCKTDREGADKTAELIRATGARALTVHADVGQPSDCRRLVDDAHREFGRLDVLVNNAGRTRFGPPEAATEDDFDDVIDTNVRGPFFLSQAAARVMGDGASIVNISSCAVAVMISHHAIYTTSKSALEGMTRQLALELAPRIRVNAIAPGPTGMERNWEYNPQFDQEWAGCIPMGKVPTPPDYVAPLIFLASDAAALITGHVLPVDGGYTLAGRSPDLSAYRFDTDQHRG